MAAHRSFAEYVKKRFDNIFWAAAESYLEANLDSVDIPKPSKMAFYCVTKNREPTTCESD